MFCGVIGSWKLESKC